MKYNNLYKYVNVFAIFLLSHKKYLQNLSSELGSPFAFVGLQILIERKKKMNNISPLQNGVEIYEQKL